jgi:hypothetical protein
VFNVLGVGHHDRSHSPISAANAATWFGDHERTSATTICTVAGFVGPALGEMLPTMFVTQANHGRDAWMLLIIVHGVHTVVEFGGWCSSSSPTVRRLHRAWRNS